VTTPVSPTIPAADAAAPDDSVLLVDKPAGWTSFDVVNRIRSHFRLRKVGHAGTLDPMATGLLIVCTGRRTRDVDAFMGLEKEYTGTLTLGARTESFDGETPVIERLPLDGVTPERIAAVLAEFAGPQMQLPPMWSALKRHGKPLYAYARKGQTVERTPRAITIHALAAEEIALPEVRFRVTCSKGTYVRSLAEDIGRRLGCGAYLSALRRTRIGEHRIESAVTVEQLVAGAWHQGVR
jgi:tRNA pseudouridine55 synthase